MKLSNQNICNLRGCQMPLGGANNFWGGAHTPPPPHLKCCPEKFLVCRKKFSVCRKSTALAPPPKKKPQKTWVPRRHCLLNNTVILRSRACTFTVGWSHCHIQNSL